MKSLYQYEVAYINGGQGSEANTPPPVVVNGGGNENNWDVRVDLIIPINDDVAVVPNVDINNGGVPRSGVQIIYRW